MIPRGQHLPHEITDHFLPSTMVFVIQTQTWKPRQKQADPRSHSEVLPIQALMLPKHPRTKSPKGAGTPTAGCSLQPKLVL